MTSMKAVGRNRVVVLHTRTVTVSLRWWARMFRRFGDVRIPWPRVRRVAWREPQWWLPGRLTIDAPGYDDPWRGPRLFGANRPHQIRFGRRRRDAFAHVFNTMSDAL